jgi:hypothetical protein
MQYRSVIEAGEPSEVTAQVTSNPGPRDAVFSSITDPSVYLLVEPPRRNTRFRSWFALAIFAGILIAMAIVVLMNG